MRLALPASIPASCFFDQQAVPNKNSKGDIRGFPNWDWKISKQSLSTSEYCKNTTHHTKWPCLLQPFFELLAFLAVLTSSELLYVCREQICQFQLVPVSSPCLLEQNFLKGVSLIFFASRQQQIVLTKHLAASGRLGSRPFCSWKHVMLCEDAVPVMPHWPHTCRGCRPAEDRRHYHFNDYPSQSATFAETSDWHAFMSDKPSIKNHGSCVNNETSTHTVLSRRPSAAWDIWDKVWRAKKKCLR